MQFGGALQRILYLIRHANPRYGPCRLAKFDLKDGFYRLFLRALDCLRLAVLLPKYPGEEQLIAIPMSCTMGWVELPPSFCVMSETVCDTANARIEQAGTSEPPAHRLEPAASIQDDLARDITPRAREPEHIEADRALRDLATPCESPATMEEVAPPSNKPLSKPLGSSDIFVDDFILLGQGGPRRMRNIRRHLLMAIDDVLSQPATGKKHRKEAVLLKKLLQGNGSWATRKVILG